MSKRTELKKILVQGSAKNKAEINVILKNKLSNYLSENVVATEVSDAIVRSQDSTAIKELLQSNQIISDYSQKQIFFEGSEDFVKLLCQRRQPLCEELEEKLLLKGSSDLVKHYVSHHSLRAEAELLLLRTKPCNVIEYYIDKHRFAQNVQLELLQLPKLLVKYVTKHQLSVEVFNTFVSSNNVDEKVLNIIISKKLPSDAEYVLAKHATVEMVERYQSTIGFSKIEEIIPILLKREMYNLVASILEKCKPDLPLRIQEQVMSSDTEVVKAYISYHDFTVSQQLELIERNNASEIIMLIKHNFVQPEAQMRILSRGNKKEIITLLEHHQTSKDFQHGVMSRNDSDEIITMCATNTLFVSVQEELIKRGHDNEIITYLDRRKLENSSFDMLLTLKNDLVSYYIRRNILNNYQMELFIEKASDDDITSYWELYYE